LSRIPFALLVPFLAVAALRAQSDDVIARYQKLVRAPESERVALAPKLAAEPAGRSGPLLRAELTRAKSKELKLALLQGLAEHARPDLASTVMEVLRPNEPDPELAGAVGKALAALGDVGVPALRAQIDRFATGRSTHANRPATYAQLLDALARMKSPAARAALVDLATKGHGYDRQLALTKLADVAREPAVDEARRRALEGDFAGLVLEGLRQISRHDPAGVSAALRVVAGRATGTMAAPLLAGIAEVGAAHLTPDVHALFFTAAAATDPTLTRNLRAHAAKLRADVAFLQFVLGRLPSLQSTAERTLAARLIVGLPGSEATVALVELSQAREPIVADTAIEALGARGDRAAVPALRRLSRSPDAERRRGALLALHQLLKAEADWRAELRVALDDVELCTLAIDLLADVGDEASLPAIHRKFASPDWRVRAAAYDFCARVRAAASVEPLLARLTVERDRLQQDVRDALESITGQRLHGETQWRAWWRDHAATFTPPPVQPKARRPRSDEGSTRTYYSIPVVSAAVMFVVDRSGSMAARVGTGGSTRLEEAKRQLVRVLTATPTGHRLGVISFANDVQKMQERLTVLDERARTDLKTRVEALVASGGTNVHDALQAAFADPDVDTIYLMTDGAPNVGAITDPVELRAAVKRWNRTRQIRIHTISLGGESEMLRGIAEDSGGQYVSVR